MYLTKKGSTLTSNKRDHSWECLKGEETTDCRGQYSLW